MLKKIVAGDKQFFKIIFPGGRVYEIFNFHLFEFARTKNKIAGTNFIAEGFALLGKAKWHVWVDGVNDVFVVSEDALGGFWAEIGFGRVISNGADMGSEHHVELLDVVPILFATVWAFSMSGTKIVWSNFFADVGNFVGAKTLVAFFAFDEWVGKSSGVARSNPSTRIHNDSGINAVDVVAFFYEILPPGLHDFTFQGDTKWTVVPSTGHTTINITAGENKTAALT